MPAKMNLPLFPLGSVLFPGVPIQLHIFEDRYKQMMELCLSTDQEFGVLLIEEGREALGPLARTHRLGTTAQVLRVQPLPEGRMHLIAVGRRRFRVHEFDPESEAYLQGAVEFFPEPEGTNDENRKATELLPLIEEYVRLVGQSEGGEQPALDLSRLPRDARALSYTAAYLLQIPQFQKQQLLELNETTALLDGVETNYRKQIALLKVVRERSEEAGAGDAGGPSLN